MVNEQLAHHGIKGMRWGIRRFQNKDGTRTPAGKKRAAANASADHKEARDLKNRSTKSLSNSEIRKLTERLQLETNLTALRPHTINRGMAVAKPYLTAVTTLASAYALSQTPLGKAVINKITKK